MNLTILNNTHKTTILLFDRDSVKVNIEIVQDYNSFISCSDQASVLNKAVLYI